MNLDKSWLTKRQQCVKSPIDGGLIFERVHNKVEGYIKDKKTPFQFKSYTMEDVYVWYIGRNNNDDDDGGSSWLVDSMFISSINFELLWTLRHLSGGEVITKR